MSDLPNIAAIREALTEQMARTGLKAKELSKKAGLNETAVRDLMDRTADPRIGTLFRLANALGCSASTLFGGLVQIGGCVRSGGLIVRAPECGCESKFVARPPDAVGELMAFAIDGDSLLPAYRDSDVVYVARDGSEPKDCLGEECVVKVEDGGLVFRTVAASAKPERFNLRSFNAPDLEDIQIEWIAPVVFVMRKRISRPREVVG